MECAQGSEIFIGALVRNLVGIAVSGGGGGALKEGGGVGGVGQTTQGTEQEMSGDGGLHRGYQGGLVILKATREASCTGESFLDQRMRATLVSPLLPL